MTYRDLVVDGQVQRRSHALAPDGYRLGDPVPGWDGYEPVAIVEVGDNVRVLVTRREPITPDEVRVVETWARLDEIARERGIEQTGGAWDVVRQMQRWYLRADPGARITAADFFRATAGLSPGEARLVRAYAVALDDPEAALAMVGPDYDPRAALAWLIEDGMQSTAARWYGEA